MKLACSVAVGYRLQPHLARKYARSTLALCKSPKSQEFCVIHFSGQNKNGKSYGLKGNVSKVLTRFAGEGKITIQFKNPEHDLYVQADAVQLKGFLHLLKRALEAKIAPQELTYSSMSVTPISNNMAPKALVIQSRSSYPAKGFPRTIEVLHINHIRRCSLDRGILQLPRLRLLDLSNNCIENLPEEINKLTCLTELNLSHNKMGKGIPKCWRWMGGNLSKTLKLLNLSDNALKLLPNQLTKLHSIVSLHIDYNKLVALPHGIGSLRHLKVLTAANNSLAVLPGTAKLWRLHSLDLANNNFTPNYCTNQAAIFPKAQPIRSLKEYAARRVLNERLSYTPETLPVTLIEYLDYAKYCVCGCACFDIYVRYPSMLFLPLITDTLCVSGATNCIPVDCYVCSLKCFSFVNSQRVRRQVI